MWTTDMSKIVLYKNWIRKQSTEIVLKVCILLHKNTTMHFISKQIFHVHVIALNCSFTSFLTLKLRVYIHMSRWMGAKEISWKVSHDAVLMFCCFDQAYTKWGYSCNPHTRSWGMPLVQPASSVGQTEKKKQNFKNRCGNSPNICFYLYKTATFTFHGPAQTPQLASCWRWSEQNTFCHTQFFFPPLVSEDILPQLHDKWLFMVLSHCREITWKKKKQGKKKIFFPDRRIPSGTSHGSLFQDEINM